jgi:predicted metal-dependent hydrolase
MAFGTFFKQLDSLRNLKQLPRLRRGSVPYTIAVKAARTLVTSRLAELNTYYNFSYQKISIRNQKTRWGSCSTAGNISINYRIVYLPAEIADYLLVHELCHTKQHNHSAAFWTLVAEQAPDYKHLRKELMRYRF